MTGMESAVTCLGVALIVTLGVFVWGVARPERKRGAWLKQSGSQAPSLTGPRVR